MITTLCPRCAEKIRIPDAEIPHDAFACCPLCQESFPASEILDRLPPVVELLGADGEPLVQTSAEEAVEVPVGAIDEVSSLDGEAPNPFRSDVNQLGMTAAAGAAAMGVAGAAMSEVGGYGNSDVDEEPLPTPEELDELDPEPFEDPAEYEQEEHELDVVSEHDLADSEVADEDYVTDPEELAPISDGNEDQADFTHEYADGDSYETVDTNENASEETNEQAEESTDEDKTVLLETWEDSTDDETSDADYTDQAAEMETTDSESTDDLDTAGEQVQVGHVDEVGSELQDDINALVSVPDESQLPSGLSGPSTETLKVEVDPLELDESESFQDSSGVNQEVPPMKVQAAPAETREEKSSGLGLAGMIGLPVAALLLGTGILYGLGADLSFLGISGQNDSDSLAMADNDVQGSPTANQNMESESQLDPVLSLPPSNFDDDSAIPTGEGYPSGIPSTDAARDRLDPSSGIELPSGGMKLPGVGEANDSTSDTAAPKSVDPPNSNPPFTPGSESAITQAEEIVAEPASPLTLPAGDAGTPLASAADVQEDPDKDQVLSLDLNKPEGELFSPVDIPGVRPGAANALRMPNVKVEQAAGEEEIDIEQRIKEFEKNAPIGMPQADVVRRRPAANGNMPSVLPPIGIDTSENDSAPEIAELDDPRLIAAVENARGAVDRLGSTIGTLTGRARKRSIAQTYVAVSKIGAVNASAKSQLTKNFLEDLGQSPLLSEFDGSTASDWLRFPNRPTEGIVMVGNLEVSIGGLAIRLPAGELVNVEFQDGASLPPGRIIATGKIISENSVVLNSAVSLD